MKPADEPLRASDRVWCRGFIVFWAVWGAVILAIRTSHPGLEIGDGLNDADVLHASEWFAAHGYGPTKFLPVRETVPAPGMGPRPSVYNTFPPGVFWIHEAFRALGAGELWHFRVLSVLWSQVALLAWFIVSRRLTGSAAIAACSGALYAISRPYLGYAGGLWEHLPMLTLMLTLGAWLAYERAADGLRRRAWPWLLAAVVCNFLDEWLTVQHGMMVAVFIGVRAMLHGIRVGRWSRLGAAMIVGCMPVVVLALRFAHQVWYSGTAAKAIAYLRGPLEHRMGEGEPSLTAARVLAWWALRLGFPGRRDGEVLADKLVLYPALRPAILVGGGLLLLLLVIGWRRDERRPMRLAVLNGALLIAAACTWPVVMKQHAFLHAFPVLMFMPGAALVLAGLTMFGLSCARGWPGRARPPAWRRAALALATAAIWFPFIRQLGYSDALNRVLPLNPRARAEVMRRADRAELIGQAGRTLRWAHQDRDVRAIRIFPRQPAVAYWLDHPFYHHGWSNRTTDLHRQLLAVDLAQSDGRAAMGPITAALGLPDLVSEPGDLAVFPAIVGTADQRTRRLCIEAPAASGVRVREVRWSWTLDGRAATVAVHAEGAIAPGDAPRMWMVAMLEDAEGRLIACEGAPFVDPRTLRAAARSDRAAGPPGPLNTHAVFIEFPALLADRAHRVRVEVGGLDQVSRFNLDVNRPSPASDSPHAPDPRRPAMATAEIIRQARGAR